MGARPGAGLAAARGCCPLGTAQAESEPDNRCHVTLQERAPVPDHWIPGCKA